VRLVGITQRVVIDRLHGERRDALDQRWPKFLAAAGLGAVPLPNDPELALRLAAGTPLAGVVFTGGNDLVAYGGDAPERDATEEALIAWVRGQRMPLLGVCRGMQVIQHSLGVRLEKIGGHVTASHPAIVSGHARSVNSYHNYATRATVPSLEVWATTQDGAIEGVRHLVESLLGVMWHPERTSPFDVRDVEMFRSFFGAGA